MESIGHFLDSQPFIALFLVIGLGYAAGGINIAAFSLGIGAVLFVGLAVGAIAPKAAPPGLLGLIGLVLFLYGIGIQYGKDFFAGLVSPLGIKANLLALVAVVVGCAVAIVMADSRFGIDFAAGIFAGSMTSTASLQAAIAAAGNTDPAVGYAMAYPFGVFGPILCFYLAKILFRPKIEQPTPRRLVVAEARAGDRGLTGVTIAELLGRVPQGDRAAHGPTRLRRTCSPTPSLELQADDILSVPPDSARRRRAQARRLGGCACRPHKARLCPGLCLQTWSGRLQAQGPAATRRLPGAGDAVCAAATWIFIPRPGSLVIEYGDQIGVFVEPAAVDKRSVTSSATPSRRSPSSTSSPLVSGSSSAGWSA